MTKRKIFKRTFGERHHCKVPGLNSQSSPTFSQIPQFSNPEANHLAAKIKCPRFCVSTLLIQFIQCFYKTVQWQQFHLSA